MHNVQKQIANDRSFLEGIANGSERGWQRLPDPSAGSLNVYRSDPPANFHFPYLVGRPTPYQSCDGNGREHVCGGVLGANQVVWLEQPLHDGKTSGRVAAFTPSAGMIRLDPRGLLIARPQR